ncbi:hypothetical protein B0H11DRAFT_1978892 [Mycena galericulata]|nr:hypothetical protein B0H11DRAFT_1978892 [Mycena galericulata]
MMGWTGQEWEDGFVAELDSAMNSLFDSIPPHLRWDPVRRGLFFDQSAVLHATYYYTQITIHRPYIHTNSKTRLSGPSITICTTAARSALNIANTWLDRFRRLPFPFLQNPTFVSAVILLLNIFENKRAGLSMDISKDLSQVQTALTILKFTEPRWQSAGRLWELLQDLQSLDNPSSFKGPSTTDPSHGATRTSFNSLPRDPPRTAQAGTPAPNYSGNANDVYTQNGRTFEPGTSIEQLLAETPAPDSIVPANGWNQSTDDEVMSMWLTAPTDFMNIDQWDAYIQNINVVDVDWQ